MDVHLGLTAPGRTRSATVPADSNWLNPTQLGLSTQRDANGGSECARAVLGSYRQNPARLGQVSDGQLTGRRQNAALSCPSIKLLKLENLVARTGNYSITHS
ncbi:protein of unknown function [Burkholderia multivorans]